MANLQFRYVRQSVTMISARDASASENISCVKVNRKRKRFDLLTLCPLLSNEGDGKVDVDSERNNLHDRLRCNRGGDDNKGKDHKKLCNLKKTLRFSKTFKIRSLQQRMSN